MRDPENFKKALVSCQSKLSCSIMDEIEEKLKEKGFLYKANPTNTEIFVQNLTKKEATPILSSVEHKKFIDTMVYTVELDDCLCIRKKYN
jgi:hypothetical protein